MTEEKIKNLSPYYRDFCEVWGNQWAPAKVMPGTCEACVFGRGEHMPSCTAWGWAYPLHPVAIHHGDGRIEPIEVALGEPIA